MKKTHTTHYLDETINNRNVPLIAGIASDVRDKINEQIQHLANLESGEFEDKSENSRFKDMAAGARTVLNLLEDTSWGKTGTTNWLSKMDKSQLEFAKKEAERMINAKNNESRESLYFAECMGHVFVTPIEKKANEWVFQQLGKIANKEIKVSRNSKKNPFTEQDYSVNVIIRTALLSEINDTVDGSEIVPDEHLGSSVSFRRYVKEKSASV